MAFTNDSPIYVQIAENIRTRILSGDLSSGDQLMSTTQYATTYRINPATANKAFNDLVAEGIIYKRRGIGMFVTDDAPDILRERGRADYRDTVLGPAVKTGITLGMTPEAIHQLIDDIVEDK